MQGANSENEEKTRSAAVGANALYHSVSKQMEAWNHSLFKNTALKHGVWVILVFFLHL